MISEQQQAKQQQMKDYLRNLTFFQLSTVPELIPKYLSIFDGKQLRNIMLLNTQTFLQWHKHCQNYNPRRNQFAESIIQCQKKPLGKQMLYLLRSICCFCLEKQLPLELILLQIQPSFDHLFIESTYKVILASLMEHSQTARLRADYVSALIMLLDLVADLNDVWIDNSKALLNVEKKGESNELINKKLQEIQQMLVMLVSQNHQLYDGFTNYGLNLIKKYSFVMLEEGEKPEKRQLNPQKEEKILIQVQEQNGLKSHLKTQKILDLLKLCSQFEEKQAFIINCYYTCLRNMDSLPLQSFYNLYNTISVTLNQTLNLELAKQSQPIQTITTIKSNLYCLLIGAKMMLAIREAKTDLQTMIIEIDSVLKGLLAFKIPQIQVGFLFTSTLTFFDIENEELAELVLPLIEYMVQTYAKKYPIKKQEYIFGVNLINCKQVMVFWRKNRKQVKIEGKTLFQPMYEQLHKYEPSQARILFETMNVKLLDFLVKVYTNDSTLFILEANQIKFQETKRQYIQSLFKAVQSRFSKQMILLSESSKTSKKEDSMQQQKPKSKNRILEEMLDIWLQRSSVLNPLPSNELVIAVKMLQILKVLRMSQHIQSKEKLLQALIKTCKQKCFSSIVNNANLQLLSIAIPSKKMNNQVAENSDIKARNELLDTLYLVLVFVHSLSFAINPSANGKDFINALVLNSFLCQDKIEDLLIDINKKQPGLWRDLTSYQEILIFSQKYDVLECFYQSAVSKIQQQNKQKFEEARRNFEKFCRQWLSSDEHYQWLSQQTKNRQKLLSIKQYCLAYRNFEK